MSLVSQGWLLSGRVRRKLSGRKRPVPVWREQFRNDLICRYAPGSSFADIGCLFGAHGRLAFLAEEMGATRVTAFDAAPASEEFLAAHSARSSDVRFVRGDLQDAAAMKDVGVHDVTWCTGVLYHAPNPLLALHRLRTITGKLLVLGSLTVPEVPGIAQACVFYPHLPDDERKAYGSVWPVGAQGISTPFDMTEHGPYPNYWWGLTPSAIEAMVKASGFDIVESVVQHPFDMHLLARPRS